MPDREFRNVRFRDLGHDLLVTAYYLHDGLNVSGRRTAIRGRGLVRKQLYTGRLVARHGLRSSILVNTVRPQVLTFGPVHFGDGPAPRGDQGHLLQGQAGLRQLALGGPQIGLALGDGGRVGRGTLESHLIFSGVDGRLGGIQVACA